MISTDRREFIGSLAAAFFSPLLNVAGHQQRPGPRLTFTYCRDIETVMDGIADGIKLGIEEATHAAAMFGGSVAYRFFSFGGSPIFGQPFPPPPPIDPTPDSIQIVIPGLMDDALMAHTISTAKSAGAIVINANARNDEAYRACHSHVFHVKPSPDTLRAARETLPVNLPGRMELWAPTLSRFGADTLNKRYQSSSGHRMESSIWGGWFAVKCAWEAALKSKATTSEELVAYLERPQTRFDGHKGVPLSFNASHELVQPLYLVDRGDVKAESDPLVFTQHPRPGCR